MIDERSVEVPWLLSRILGARTILDVGVSDHAASGGSYLTQLKKQGCEVWAIDVRPRDVPAGVRFIQEDIVYNTLPDHYFDLVLCISTIEHVGYAGYELLPFEDGPQSAMREMWRVLVPQGRLLLSAPLGKPRIERWPGGQFCQFSWEEWQELCTGWTVVEHRTWRFMYDRYVPCRPESLHDCVYLGNRAEGVVATELRKES